MCYINNSNNNGNIAIGNNNNQHISYNNDVDYDQAKVLKELTSRLAVVLDFDKVNLIHGDLERFTHEASPENRRESIFKEIFTDIKDKLISNGWDIFKSVVLDYLGNVPDNALCTMVKSILNSID